MHKDPYQQAYYQAHREQILERRKEYWKEYRRTHRELYRSSYRKWYYSNPKKKYAQQLLHHNLEKYPLEEECQFCGAKGKLEHGHIDYDYPELYLTVCHKCNWYMDHS